MVKEFYAGPLIGFLKTSNLGEASLCALYVAATVDDNELKCSGPSWRMPLLYLLYINQVIYLESGC